MFGNDDWHSVVECSTISFGFAVMKAQSVAHDSFQRDFPNRTDQPTQTQKLAMYPHPNCYS